MAIEVHPSDAPTAALLPLDEAQAALAAEWQAAAPETPADVTRFYRTSQCQAADNAAWHATAGRQAITAQLLRVARDRGAARVVDIGCGVGRDLAALRDALPGAVLVGVEPNIVQRRAVRDAALATDCVATIEHAPLEEADLLICVDVLEHIVDPETFLGTIAQRAPLGCLLFETTATHDISTPLHLANNIGWHPGRVLDRYGWEQASYGNARIRVWQRTAVAAPPRAALMLIAYRACAIPTMGAIVNLLGMQGSVTSDDQVSTLTGRPRPPWNLRMKAGDGLITRSRAISLSRWWAECNDDVALMIDDDVVFQPEEAARLVEACRQTRSIVCGAYPVGDATHMALRPWDDGADIGFCDDAPLVDIQFAATGFMAIHRDVVDALMPTMGWVHEDQPWAFKPLFETMVFPMGKTHALISEDWAFSQRAREQGFTIWLDPRVRPIHLKPVEISVNNYLEMAEAIKLGKGG